MIQFALLVAFFSPKIFPNVELQPGNGGRLIETRSSAGAVTERAVYYSAVDPATGNSPVSAANSTILDSDNLGRNFKFVVFDLRRTQISREELTGDSYRPNMLLFDVSSTKTDYSPQSNQEIVLTIWSASSLSSGPKLVPIASVNGQDCTYVLGCRKFALDVNGHYFGVKYTPGETLRIGLYPKDICTDYAVQTTGGTGLASGCSVDVVNGGLGPVPSSGSLGSPAVMQLSFSFGLAGTTSPVATPTEIGSEKADLVLKFQTDVPTLSCGATALADIYYPGDGEVFVNTNLLSTQVFSGRAPVTDLIVVGREGSAPVIAPPAFPSLSDYSLLVRTTLGGQREIGGFTNTSDGTDHQYFLRFMVRDATGVIAAPASCVIQNVQTAAIEGFLQKGNVNFCFIATAAFRSIHAEPVKILREFRDRVLLSTALGESVVELYYRWSPRAAYWLNSHPVFKIPVLSLLIPIEVIAWIFIHPRILGVIFVLALLVLGYARYGKDGDPFCA